MKLNIEELAREAAAQASADYARAVDDGGVISWESAKMHNFARLIVERCAQECENIARIDYSMTDLYEYGECADRIRNLLED